MKKWLTQKRALIILLVVFGSLLGIGIYLMPEEGYDKVREEQAKKRMEQMKEKQRELDEE